ncbi:MAG: DUF5309 family protein, partial [Muribaculaceae bacterium]|nr:DUF5309 family protein [Muribaculaceae bacterium]
MSTQIINGGGSGRHVIDGPLTLAATDEAVPGFMLNSIDSRIVKVRPMSTPIDQLSRCGDSRRATSMTVEYYSVDPKHTEAKTTAVVSSGAGKRRADGIYTHTIHTTEDLIFEPSETVILPDIAVKDKDGNSAGPLVFYIVGRLEGGGIEVMAINAPKDEDGKALVPEIPKDSTIIRMGRAATELDVQTAQFQSLPTKAYNNCQIFKMQVEEGTFYKIARKEVGWDFSDQEEAAIIDMRMGMEKNFLFGARAKIVDPNKHEEVYLTGGIWNQAPRHTEIDIDDFSESSLIEIARQAFTENCGSKRKIFICGSELISRITKIECKHVRHAADTKVKWGLRFDEIVTNFGNLCVI